MKNRFCFLFVITGLLIGSCNTEQVKESNEDSSQDSIEASVQPQVRSYVLPSPLQIASILKSSGIGYVEGLTNQKNDYAKYVSNTSKAFNLGVYTGDLAYCVLNKQTQEALSYIKLSRQMAEGLGMASIFDASSAFGRFEKNLGNQDSLMTILTDLQMETDAYLDEAEQQNTALIIYSGAWIEVMYIGSKFFKDNSNNKLSRKITEQMVVLHNLLTMMESNNIQDPFVVEVVGELSSLKKMYDNFDSVKKSVKAESEGMEQNIALANDELESLSLQVQKIRSMVTIEKDH